MGAPTPYHAGRLRPRLDPCCDYIVFEAAESASHRLWPPLRRVLRSLRDGILTQRVHHDLLTGRSLLVVKLDPRKGEGVKRAVLNMRLSQEMVISLYNRQSTAPGQGHRNRVQNP